MTYPFKPDWTIPPEPKGEDEDEARAMYEAEMACLDPDVCNFPNGRCVEPSRCKYPHMRPWDELGEWQREAWRRELRDR